MTRATTNHRQPVQRTGAPLTHPRMAWSRVVSFAELLGGGLLALAFFVALVYAAAFFEILMTPLPCESDGTCMVVER